MKRKTKYLVYPLAIFLMSLFVIVGCSDDDDDIIDENLPTVTTEEVTNITQTSAKSGGNITDNGGATVTARGVIWSKDADLTVNDYEGITVDGAGAGSFTSNITGLEPEIQYYVRAYATTNNGTGYGNTLAFTTLESRIVYGGGVTDIDGNEYVTVIIGNQEWMAENLRVTRYNNGDYIPAGLSDAEWINTTEGAYAIYYNDDDMLEAYGKLYNWYAVDDARGLCPAGWSVPSDDDWTQLVDYVVAQGYSNEWDDPIGAGNALKSCRQVGSPLDGCNTSEHPRWDSIGPHHGFDQFGFSALPGGYCGFPSFYYGIGFLAYWWSSSAHSSAEAGSWYIVSENDFVSGSGSDTKIYGFSIRCVKNTE